MEARIIDRAVNAQIDLMAQVNQFVYSHPELSYHEFACADHLTGKLESLGLTVERPIAGLETAFKATLRGRARTPAPGLVMLYDAVPIFRSDGTSFANHSCGHHVIAAAVVGAVAALAELDDRPGDVVVMGMPADEIGSPDVAYRGGAKAVTAAAGLWDDVQAALYIHPEFQNTVFDVSHWMNRYEVTFSHPRELALQGELKHSPMGVLGELLGTLREFEKSHTQSGFRVKSITMDGEFEEGGLVHVALQVLVYGLSAKELKVRSRLVMDAVDRLSKAAEMPISMAPIGEPYMAVLPNRILGKIIMEAMTELGLEVDDDPFPLPFATDFGNVTQRVPGAMIGVGRKEGWKFHTVEGDAEFCSPDAHKNMIEIAKVFALTTVRLWENPRQCGEINREFQRIRD